MPARVIDAPREAGGKIVRVAGAVGDEVLAPAIEDVPVRIGEAVVDVGLELERARLETIGAGVGVAHRRAPGRLDLRVMEGALLEIEGAAAVDHEAVHRMMRV